MSVNPAKPDLRKLVINPKGVNHAWVEYLVDGVWYNAELQKPISEVNDRTRVWIYYQNATRKDIDEEIGMRE